MTTVNEIPHIEYDSEDLFTIDIERMKKALAQPSIIIQQGLSRDEMIEFICNFAKEEQ